MIKVLIELFEIFQSFRINVKLCIQRHNIIDKVKNMGDYHEIQTIIF